MDKIQGIFISHRKINIETCHENNMHVNLSLWRTQT